MLAIYWSIFPDSQIVRDFKCSRIKISAILNKAMKPESKEHLRWLTTVAAIQVWRTWTLFAYIYLMSKEASKLNASSLTCAWQVEGAVLMLRHSNLINSALKKDGIDWDYVASFGLENIDTSIWNRNSLKCRVHRKNKDIFVASYNCHLCHLASAEQGEARRLQRKVRSTSPSCQPLLFL